MSQHIQAEFEIPPFFDVTPDLVCIAGKDGFFRKINQSVLNKLGYTEAELFSRPISSFIHPEDKDLTGRKRAELLNGKALINFQNRYVTKTGKIIWLDWTSIYFSDKEVVFAIAKDVTERKQIENDIEEKYKKFKSLTTHFKTRIEKDRKYLAVELHEELAQLAAAVKMDLDWISNNNADMDLSSKNRVSHALAVSQVLINTIRRISYSVSPGMLDDLGLNETLKWHCQEFAILNSIPCVFTSAYDTDHLTQEIQLDLFRICQESLNNIIDHAQASTVRVTLEAVACEIILSIVDDGKGFDVDQQRHMSGLTNMRELAASVNGRLTVTSKPGQGTKVCFAIGLDLAAGRLPERLKFNV